MPFTTLQFQRCHPPLTLTMQASQSMFNLSSVASPHYVPSHLRQSQSRTPQPPKNSPPRIRRSSTISKFGGPSFGTPKPSRSSRSQEQFSEDAPPTESIYDYNGGSSFSASQTTNPDMPSFESSSQKTVPSLASLPTAVIIFGFPSQMTSKVLDHFSKFGRIEEHSSSTAQNLSMGNNWMKITYKDPTAAQQAVAANGTFVGGQYMIGCVYAQEDQLANVDKRQDDAMDIDPQTPPRLRNIPTQYRPGSQQSSTPLGNFNNSTMRTPIRSPPPNHGISQTPGGRKIEILSSEAIYKSNSPITERAASWMPSWLISNTEEQKIAGTPEPAGTQAKPSGSWTGNLVRGLVDTIFGF